MKGLIYNDATGFFDEVDQLEIPGFSQDPNVNNAGYWDWESAIMDKPSTGVPPEQKECWHEWTKYEGFNESYWYCKLCDIKKDLDKVIG